MRLKVRRGAWIFAPLLFVASIFSLHSAKVVNAIFECATTYNSVNFIKGGSATESNGTITLTTAQNSQFGAIWNTSRINLNNDFCVEAEVFLGNFDFGADGLAFVMQPNSVAAGSLGGRIGVYGNYPFICG